MHLAIFSFPWQEERMLYVMNSGANEKSYISKYFVVLETLRAIRSSVDSQKWKILFFKKLTISWLFLKGREHLSVQRWSWQGEALLLWFLFTLEEENLATKGRKGKDQTELEEGTEFYKQKVEVTYLEIGEDESIEEEVDKSRTGS